MKFNVTFKDPDALIDAVTDAVVEQPLLGLDEYEAELVREKRISEVNELCQQWFQYGEYVTVEIDTVANTCTVVPVSSYPDHFGIVDRLSRG